MTRQPHDQFAKQYLAELLASLGQVEISREIIAEVQPETNLPQLWILATSASTALLGGLT